MSAALHRTIVVSAATCVLGSLALAPPASGVVVDSGSEQESFKRVETDFCGAGLRVKVRGTFETRWRAVPHGPDGMVYYVAQTRIQTRFTNTATGAYVDEVVRTTERDQSIVVEEDTLLIEILATGSAKVRDQDGKLIAANPGQVRFQLRVPHNGTPTDPLDDGEAEFVQVTRDSTGRNDDFCENVVPALS
jgi:hypothetical protein